MDAPCQIKSHWPRKDHLFLCIYSPLNYFNFRLVYGLELYIIDDPPWKFNSDIGIRVRLAYTVEWKSKSSISIGKANVPQLIDWVLGLLARNLDSSQPHCINPIAFRVLTRYLK